MQAPHVGESSRTTRALPESRWNAAFKSSIDSSSVHGLEPPQEIANAMVYLLHSDFVTGDLIFVTGGEHL